MRRPLKVRIWPALLVAVVVTAFLPRLIAQQAPELPNPGSTSISRQQQQQLGLKAMGEVYKQMPVLPDSHPLTQYVRELGRKLQAVIPSQYSWPYQFHVVQQKEINAFALPGGPIFINVGTIQMVHNEAELAGVMSHEMSHIYMQHTAKSIPKQEFAQIFAGILGAVLPGSTAGNLARLGIQVGAGTVLLKYSRADEAQADAVGAIIMYKAGYNPRALAAFFETLEGQGGGGGVQFLSDHPNPGNRQAAISREVENWPAKNYLANSESFASAKQEAASVRAYTAQEIAQGAKQGVWFRYNQRNGAIPRDLPVSAEENAPNR
jgi:beta-barrel assembly-enhancing protease